MITSEFSVISLIMSVVRSVNKRMWTKETPTRKAIRMRSQAHPITLALNLSVRKSPNRARNSVRVRNSVKIFVLERFRHRPTGMRIVVMCYDFRRNYVLVVRAVKIEFESYVGGKVEIRVQRTSSVAGFNRLGSGEFIDVVGAGARAFETFLDAIAFGPHSRKGEIDFGDYTGDVEAPGVADTATVLGSEAWADGVKWAGESASDKERADESPVKVHGVGAGVDLKAGIAEAESVFIDRTRL
jgi:hypothetical protein